MSNATPEPHASHQHLILSAIGSDRPGLVDEVTEFIFHRGGNIEDSRMVNLRGQFAMMVLIGCSEAVMSKVRSDLPQLVQKSRLHVELRPAGQSVEPRAAAARPYKLVATAMDQPGLVHRVSHLLRSMEVNIESLDTRLSAAPITGAPVFEMTLTLAVPQQTPIAKLREKLGQLCDEANIDWEMTTF